MGIMAKINLNMCEELLEKLVPNERILNYRLKCFGENKDYVQLKIATEEDEYTLIVYLVRDNEEGKYGSLPLLQENIYLSIQEVHIKGYNKISPENIGVFHLKCVLRSLAYYNSESIAKGCVKITGHDLSKNSYEMLFHLIDNNNFSHTINPQLLKEFVGNLVHSSKEVLRLEECNMYVRSYNFQNELFFKYIHNERVHCKAVNTTSKKYLPLVYDMLLTLFSFSNQKLRQHYFHELILYYYNKLAENCTKLQVDLTVVLSKEKFQDQINVFLPLVKLEIVCYYCEKLDKIDRNMIYKEFIWTAIFELNECLLYSKITREDCYKILETNIEVSEATVMNWTLFPKENNRHCFDLKINIKEFDKDRSVIFYTKYFSDSNEKDFMKEIFFYTEFINLANCMGLKQITNFGPRCYLVRSKEVLVLQDMRSMKYKDFDRGKSLSYKALQLVIKQLAKLHACSLLCEEIVTEKTQKSFRFHYHFNKYFQESNINSNGEDYVASEFTRTNYQISENNSGSEIKNDAYKNLRLSYTKLSTYRNVICHSSPWGSNVLFRMDEYNLPTESCLINFDMIRYCPPAFDLLLLFCMNTEKATRKKYMVQLIEQYYKEFTRIFKDFGFDLNKIYTYEHFLASFKATATTCQAIPTWQSFDNCKIDGRIMEDIKGICSDYIKDFFSCVNNVTM